MSPQIGGTHVEKPSVDSFPDLHVANAVARQVVAPTSALLPITEGVPSKLGFYHFDFLAPVN